MCSKTCAYLRKKGETDGEKDLGTFANTGTRGIKQRTGLD